MFRAVPQSLDAIAAIYASDLATSDVSKLGEALKQLDNADYLERALWPAAKAAAEGHDCRHHVKKSWVVSVMLLLHWKRRHASASWRAIVPAGAEGVSPQWEHLVATLLSLPLANDDDEEWTLTEKTALVQFLVHCFASLDEPFVAASIMKLCSLGVWTALSPSQRAIEFQEHPKLERRWRKLMGSSKDETAPPKTKRRKVAENADSKARDPTTTFLIDLCNDFCSFVGVEPTKEDADTRLRYLAVFLELVTDLLGQLPTRRFLLTVLRRRRFLAAVRDSVLVRHCLEWCSADESTALRQQLVLLEAYLRFPIDSHSGQSLSAREDRERRSTAIQALQQCVFREFRDTRLEELAIVPVSHIADRVAFTELLQPLVGTESERLSVLAIKVGVVADEDEVARLSGEDLVAAFVEEYSSSLNTAELEAARRDPLVFPTEQDIWSSVVDDFVTTDERAGVYSATNAQLFPVLPVHKLGLQFLDLPDWLQRNFELSRLDAAHGIRDDLEAAIKQLDGVRSLHTSSTGDATIFRGFSSMAVPLDEPMQIIKVSKPALGKSAPAVVLGRARVELSQRHKASTFDCFQPREVVFVVTVRATKDEAAELMGFDQDNATDNETSGLFPEEFGVLHVRAAEVVELTDDHGNAITDDSNPIGKGRSRVLTLAFDGIQYKKDLEAGAMDAYEHANLLVRRHPRENNFKAVLDTVRQAWHQSSSPGQGSASILPSWLHDLVLGYGNPLAARYQSLYRAQGKDKAEVPLFEAIIDGQHVVELGYDLVDAESGASLAPQDAVGPFTYVEGIADGQASIKAYRRAKDVSLPPQDEQALRFTKSQVTAIRTGMCDGLTVVVGPPGTGMTDVAVQLVLNLYSSSNAREQIVLVAHSDHALDNFFSKLLARQRINEGEIVRLGQAKPQQGEEEHHGDFSTRGRVAFLLQRRLELLAEVKRMATWLDERNGGGSSLSESAAYSCENALYFFQFHLKPLLDETRDATSLSADLALNKYFTARHAAAPESLAALQRFAGDMELYFGELQRLQAFELLETAKQRADLYLVHHAKILAMTCNDAALHQQRLSALGLSVTSVVVEEAAQVSELDTLIPVLMASTRDQDQSQPQPPSLKRLVLIGDSHQLPPPVATPALRSYSRLDQSLFSRLLRLGVPRVTLNQQGRARAELADLFRWRYADIDDAGLADLPRVTALPQFQRPNAGLKHVAQLVDVASGSERRSQGRSFENEGEARFVAATVQYLLAIGYRPDQIAAVTPYTAQRDLIERVLKEKTKQAAAVAVSTIDDFQSQKRDIVLLSTVRTTSCTDHFRDQGRATVAFSVARLGFYVVGHAATLRATKELAPFIERLEAVTPGGDLELVPSERVGRETDRAVVEENASKSKGKTKNKKDTEAAVSVSTWQQLEKVVAGISKTQ